MSNVIPAELADNIGDALSQAEYKQTEYADASWEVVGEIEDEKTFLPLEIEKIDTQLLVADPMFADYGGLEQAELVKRWHLPDHLAQEAAAAEAHEDVPEVPKISLTDEELAAIKAEARESGRAEALALAAEEAAGKFAGIEERLRGVFDDLLAQVLDNFKVIEEQSVMFSIEVAKKLIDSAVEINPEYILEILREAIRFSGSAQINGIRVSPQDLEFIDLIGVRKRFKEYDGTWEFKADPTIRSGCVVDTAAGTIDFRLDEAWERIKDSVVKVLA